MTQVQIKWVWFLILIGFITFLAITYRILGMAADLLLVAAAGAYLVRPIILWLEKKGVSRFWAIFSTSLLTIGLIILGVCIFAPFLYEQFLELLKSLPEILHSLVQRWNDISNRYNLNWTVNEDYLLTSIKERFSTNAEEMLAPLFKTAKSILASGIGVFLIIINIALLPLFFYYITKHYEHMVAGFWNVIPPSRKAFIRHYVNRFDRVMAGFVRGQLIDCTCLAAMYATGLAITGIKFGFTIGLVSGYLSIIPYVGTGLGLITATLVTLAYSGSYFDYVGIALTFGIGQFIESFIIQPQIVGNKVGLGPLSTLLVVIAGGNIGGFMGMLLSIPIGGVLKIVLEDTIEYYRHSQLYKSRA